MLPVSSAYIAKLYFPWVKTCIGRLLPQWWVDDGCKWLRDRLQWGAGGSLRACLYTRCWPKGTPGFWTGHQPTQVLHHLWTSRGIWTFLSVCKTLQDNVLVILMFSAKFLKPVKPPMHVTFFVTPTHCPQASHQDYYLQMLWEPVFPSHRAPCNLKIKWIFGHQHLNWIEISFESPVFFPLLPEAYGTFLKGEFCLPIEKMTIRIWGLLDFYWIICSMYNQEVFSAEPDSWL